MVPRTGPLSASSALATPSWYQRCRSPDPGVRALAGAIGRTLAGTAPGPQVVKRAPRISQIALDIQSSVVIILCMTDEERAILEAVAEGRMTPRRRPPG